MAVKILVWNIGAGQNSDIKTLTTLKANNRDETFARFRNGLALGFEKHRLERYDESLLCMGTVLFEADQ